MQIYYVYKSLAHPEHNGYINPFSLKERLLHIREAKRTLGTKIPWLCDTMQNDLKHALGNAPNSEFVIDPDGHIVRKRAWSNPEQLRKDLTELVGPVENPTKVSDLSLKTAPPPKEAARGVVERISRPQRMQAVRIEPLPGDDKQPFYAKMRAEAEPQLLGKGEGKLYLGFHMDPIYRVHWNNLAEPLKVTVIPPEGITVRPTELKAPKPDVEADVDPREFLIEVEAGRTDKPLKLQVYYFACNDEQGWCKPVRQAYAVHLERDRDAGWPRRGRRRPAGRAAGPPGRRGPFGRIAEIDLEQRMLVIRTPSGDRKNLRIAQDAQMRRNGEPCKLGDLKVGDFCRFRVDDSGKETTVTDRLAARDRRPQGLGRRRSGFRARPSPDAKPQGESAPEGEASPSPDASDTGNALRAEPDGAGQGEGGETSTFHGFRDWPQFRGPGGLGHSEATGLPAEWSARKNVLWKKPLPGAGTSSPVIYGGRLFLTAHTGYGISPREPGEMDRLKRHLLCFDRETGRQLWSRDIEAELPVADYGGRMHWHGYASSTPAVDAERVYCFFGRSGVFAFDHEGNRLWQADVGEGTHGWGTAASPVLYGDLVIVNAFVESGALVALNKQTGEEVWRAGGLKESWNTPLLVELPDGDTELAVGIFGKILGFDPQTGRQLWSCEGIGWYIVASMVAHDGVIYSIAGNKYEAVAVKAGGRGDVSGTHFAWRAGEGSNVSSPVYHDGHLYFANERQGIVYCLDAASGDIVYKKRLPVRLGNIYASPVVADGKLYYVSRQGGAVVLKAGPTFELLAHNKLDDDSVFNASPAVSGNRLYLRSDRSLYCIGSR